MQGCREPSSLQAAFIYGMAAGEGGSGGCAGSDADPMTSRVLYQVEGAVDCDRLGFWKSIIMNRELNDRRAKRGVEVWRGREKC